MAPQGRTTAIRMLEIQEWHILVADPNVGSSRATTKLIHEVKEYMKQQIKGGSKEERLQWFKEEVWKRHRAMFPEAKSKKRHELVLVKLKNRKDGKADERLIGNPKVYGHKGDEEPSYGKADWDKSLEIFFNQRSTLQDNESEVMDIRQEFNVLKARYQPLQGPCFLDEWFQDFEDTLVHYKKKLRRPLLGDDASNKARSKARSGYTPMRTLRDEFKALKTAAAKKMTPS